MNVTLLKICSFVTTNVRSFGKFQLVQCLFRTGAGGKPSTWFPPGGLVELTPANPCTRTPEQTHIHTDTRKSRSTIPHQHPHACKQDDSAASKSKKRSGLQTQSFVWRALILLCLLYAAARLNLRLPPIRCAPKFETAPEPLKKPP